MRSDKLRQEREVPARHNNNNNTGEVFISEKDVVRLCRRYEVVQLYSVDHLSYC